MAKIDWMGDMLGPVVIGVASAGAAVVEKQAVARGTGGQFLKQASLWGDVLIGGYAILNLSMDLNMPRGRDASLATAGAGIALISKRATDFIGSQVLQLPAFGRHTQIPGRSVAPRGRSLRSPGAAVETSVLPRKRQFFSIT